MKTAEQWGAYLVERIALCTIAQGAETDLGRVVYRGRRKVDDEMMPCASLVEGSGNSKDQAGRSAQVQITLAFAIHAYVLCDADNPNVAGHAAIRDLKRAVFGGDIKTSRLISYHGADIAPRVDGSAFVLAAIEFSAEVYEDLANP